MVRSIGAQNTVYAAITFPLGGIVMDRLEAMTTLLTIVDTGSFSAASRKLRTPLTTVSRRVADLETHLRTKLLHRTTRRVTLTDAGVPYVAACRRMFEQLDEAERAAGGEYQAARGALTITAPLVFGRLHLVPVAAGFMAAYPEITVNLRLSDRVLDLQDEHIDVAIRIGNLSDSALLARRIGSVRRLVCASPDYLARRGEPLHPGDLVDHDCVAFRGLDEPGFWSFGHERVPIRARMILDAMEPAIDAGIAGIGIIRAFCYHVAPALRAGTLRALLREHTPAGLPVHLVYPGGEMMPLKLRAFLDYCAPRLQARIDSARELRLAS